MNITERQLAQQLRRLSWMPWLYFRLKPALREKIQPLQLALQQDLMTLETVNLDQSCFIAPEAELFAEPGRPIRIGAQSAIAANVFLHGPIDIAANVCINHHCSLDGGQAGIRIGEHTRIAHHCSLYAFNHGLRRNRPIWQQRVTSEGIVLGRDVWVGARCVLTDGVIIGDHAVIGAGSVVTRNVADWAIVAGNPAVVIGDRREKGEDYLREWSVT